MSAAKFRMNLRTGEVEIEGSEEFVQRQIDELDALLSLVATPRLEEGPKPSSISVNESEVALRVEMPDSFGAWMHSFRPDLSEDDQALITARYVQSQVATNDFRTADVNKSLQEHGIRLSNPSRSLMRLGERKLLFQTRRAGGLRFMRVSVDGERYLETLKR